MGVSDLPPPGNCRRRSESPVPVLIDPIRRPLTVPTVPAGTLPDESPSRLRPVGRADRRGRRTGRRSSGPYASESSGS